MASTPHRVAPAPGETDLPKLLATLTTAMHPATFVFVSFPVSEPFSQATIPASLFTQMMFREAEGTTVITTKTSAEELELEYNFPCRMITLNVHSSLEAVGFIAAVARELTKRGIGVNPVSGFFHDHLFIPLGREDEALEVLGKLALQNR